VLGAFAALALTSPALAAPPAISNVSISGPAQVGGLLTASATIGHASETGKMWFACTSQNDPYKCTDYLGDGNTYRVQPSDQGDWIRVAVWADAPGYSKVWEVSDATAKITAAPTPTPTPTRTPTPTPTPTKTPTPTPTPTKTPTPTPTPTKTPTPTPSPSQPPQGAATPTPTPTPFVTVVPTPTAQPLPPANNQDPGQTWTPPASTTAVITPTQITRSGATGQVLGATDRSTANVMIKPFPEVHLSGRLTATGARITVLTVKVPKGVTVTVRCSGKGCPMRQLAHASAVWHAKAFETELRAGTKLTITIAKPGYITTVTTITIRRGTAPRRSDMCRFPGSGKLRSCPKR
jgi:hypothetical protein